MEDKKHQESDSKFTFSAGSVFIEGTAAIVVPLVLPFIKAYAQRILERRVEPSTYVCTSCDTSTVTFTNTPKPELTCGVCAGTMKLKVESRRIPGESQLPLGTVENVQNF